MPTAWPKKVIQLTPEQARTKSDWESYWLGDGIQRYSFVERFNERVFSSLQMGDVPRKRTLEIGPGKGNFVTRYLKPGEEYFCVDRREDFCRDLAPVVSEGHAVCADVQEKMPFDDGFFDRIIAVHILEHLPDLPAALAEVRRLLTPAGAFDVVIPCEGTILYSLGRKLSSERAFKRRFSEDFGPIIKSDHVNTAQEIIEELERDFVIETRFFSPLTRVPVVALNLLAGFRLKKRMAKAPSARDGAA